MAKKTKQQPVKRFMWEFPGERAEMRDATARIADHLKPQERGNNGHALIAGNGTRGSGSVAGIHDVQDRRESAATDNAQPSVDPSPDGHY